MVLGQNASAEKILWSLLDDDHVAASRAQLSLQQSTTTSAESCISTHMASSSLFATFIPSVSGTTRSLRTCDESLQACFQVDLQPGAGKTPCGLVKPELHLPSGTIVRPGPRNIKQTRLVVDDSLRWLIIGMLFLVVMVVWCSVGLDVLSW
ncbi:unnamed protein product [Symbiodinium sp. CCMP2592]|nr:unnamed protein product [Symbiodinium sp. CCMP2592]